ncbi:hypothetical protein LJC56_09185 [Christensenellaceae bacterium OttesenSCG-928-K19]|nr:hypothetical protein [Christensenellaceae bacterium OttesenSCG-928-K19]
MRKAYDTFLQSEVSADLAARSGGSEPYRYECAHCGEEVRLAAAESINMVTHFRHRNGNNDVGCEDYLGQYGTINIDSRSRKSRNERAEFYFDSSTKMFSLGLCFSEHEIDAYEKESAKFELRTSAQEQAFFSLSINNNNFMPDTPRLISIEKFAYNYFLSNTHNNIKRRYGFFKKDHTPTFFKILGNDDDYRAKLIRSAILYTDVPYFVAVVGQYSFPKTFNFSNDIEISDTYRFETMGRRVLGQVLTIKNKTADVDSLFASWGYQIESSETLTLLWPPVIQKNEVSTIHVDYAFLFSSFNLEPHGNINVHSTDIKRLEGGVSRVSVNSRVKIYRKNAEIMIEAERPLPVEYDSISIEKIQTDVYKALDDCTHFLFNHSGTIPISEGQTVMLTPGSSVKRFDSGYLEGIVYPKQQNELSGESLLTDLLIHYKRMERFSSELFDALELSETASHYTAKCRKSGVINSAARRFIEEGLI